MLDQSVSWGWFTVEECSKIACHIVEVVVMLSFDHLFRDTLAPHEESLVYVWILVVLLVETIR